MGEYMLVRKGAAAAWGSLSADEKQRLMEKYVSFVSRLKREERFCAGSGLAAGGMQLKRDQGILLTEGPYAETKEAISGYLVFRAANQEEALAIARECPALVHGESVELFAMSGN